MEGVVTLKVRPTFEAVQIQLRHLRRAVLGHAQRPVAATLRVLPCSAREPVLGLSAGLLGLSCSCAQRCTAVGLLPAARSAMKPAAGKEWPAVRLEAAEAPARFGLRRNSWLKEESEEERFEEGEGHTHPATRPPTRPPT